MKKKYLTFILATALFTSFSLSGCGEKQPEEPQPTESIETTETEDTNSTESTESLETTEGTETTESTEVVSNSKSKDYECVFYIDSIEEKGIYLSVYDEDDDMNNYGSVFFVSKENASIKKNGKTSLYDSLYFYEGCVVKFTGTINEKYSSSELIPDNGTKVIVDLVADYKDIKKDEDKEKDETDINIINNDKFKSDVQFSGVWCKFYYPPELAKLYEITEQEGQETSVVVCERVTKTSRHTVFTIERVSNEDNKYEIGIINDSGNHICLYKTDAFAYIMKIREEDEVNQDDVKELRKYIEKTILIIE